MDYKECAIELLEILLSILVECDSTEEFNAICKMYPELLDEYIQRIERDSEAPELMEEEETETSNG